MVKVAFKNVCLKVYSKGFDYRLLPNHFLFVTFYAYNMHSPNLD